MEEDLRAWEPADHVHGHVLGADRAATGDHDHICGLEYLGHSFLKGGPVVLDYAKVKRFAAGLGNHRAQ